MKTKKEKMFMTFKLASDLMDALAALYLSAINPGNCEFTEEDIENANKYARETYITICDDFEAKMAKKWEVIMGES